MRRDCTPRCSISRGRAVRVRGPYLSQDHEGHAQPPPRVLEVRVSLAGLLVVLLVGLQQAMLLDDEGHADEQARGDGQTDADDLVRAWSRRRVAAEASTAGV